MTVDGNTLYFTYDASGTPQTVTYNGTTYYYATNLQGDITAILDNTGTTVVSYTYDAWGSHTSGNNGIGTLASTLGRHNPLRYRGYVYDVESELYYLQSRYYNPVIGRFINADIFIATGQGVLGNNVFAYCLNNPICLVDLNGKVSYEAVDSDGDGDIDYYKYEYTFSYIVLLADDHNLGSFNDYEVTAHGTVYFFMDADDSFFSNLENIPHDFDPSIDLLIGISTSADLVNYQAYQAHRPDIRMRKGITEAIECFDKEMNTGLNRTSYSLLIEWNWHMRLGGNFGLVDRLANVDFDSKSEDLRGGNYILLAIEEVLKKVF